MNSNILVFFKDFSQVSDRYSHIGLGVSAYMLEKVLQNQGFNIESVGVTLEQEIEDKIRASSNLTHVIIEAVWINPLKLEAWLQEFNNINFVVRIHSQIGFLVVEPGAIWQIKILVDLQKDYNNFKIAANSKHLEHWLNITHDISSKHLPNVYYKTSPNPHVSEIDKLKISSFGALRASKNHTTSAAVAQLIAKRLNKPLEFFVNTHREEHGRGVIEALRAMFSGNNKFKLIEVPWTSWSEFKKKLAQMHLALQLSHTETFNICTADAVNEYVPSVVTRAINWVPEYWQIDSPDNIEQACKIGIELLQNRYNSAKDGIIALDEYNFQAINHWKNYLG